MLVVYLPSPGPRPPRTVGHPLPPGTRDRLDRIVGEAQVVEIEQVRIETTAAPQAGSASVAAAQAGLAARHPLQLFYRPGGHAHIHHVAADWGFDRAAEAAAARAGRRYQLRR